MDGFHGENFRLDHSEQSQKLWKKDKKNVENSQKNVESTRLFLAAKNV